MAHCSCGATHCIAQKKGLSKEFNTSNTLPATLAVTEENKDDVQLIILCPTCDGWIRNLPDVTIVPCSSCQSTHALTKQDAIKLHFIVGVDLEKYLTHYICVACKEQKTLAS